MNGPFLADLIVAMATHDNMAIQHVSGAPQCSDEPDAESRLRKLPFRRQPRRVEARSPTPWGTNRGDTHMATHTSPRQEQASTAQRERTLSMIGGALGIVMFLLGFLRWLKIGDDPEQTKYSGFAFQMPTTAVIGFSLAAGLMAFLGAREVRAGRGVPSAIPTALAATSFVLAVGVYLGKGEISPDLGSDVGVEIGLVLALITSLIQTVILGIGLASRYDNDTTGDTGRSRQHS
jgi:uncharacterized membrane protein